MPSSPMRRLRRAAARIAPAIAEMSPLERERARIRRGPDPFTVNPSHHGRTPRRDYICPAKQYRNHPDASVRAIAFAQAREQHAMNDYIAHGEVHPGRCPAKACRGGRANLPMSMFAKNDQTLRIAIGLKRQAIIRERGY